jgi:hypothetical protein
MSLCFCLTGDSARGSRRRRRLVYWQIVKNAKKVLGKTQGGWEARICAPAYDGQLIIIGISIAPSKELVDWIYCELYSPEMHWCRFAPISKAPSLLMLPRCYFCVRTWRFRPSTATMCQSIWCCSFSGEGLPAAPLWERWLRTVRSSSPCDCCSAGPWLALSSVRPHIRYNSSCPFLSYTPAVQYYGSTANSTTLKFGILQGSRSTVGCQNHSSTHDAPAVQI